jgi:hypothetical protein
MDDTSILRKLDRLGAPSDFESRVLTELARRRATQAADRRTRTLRYSLAGAAAALFAGFFILNVFVLRKGDLSQAGARSLAGLQYSLPITETMNYRNEVRNASPEPRTIYILEQVSDSPSKYIKY